ncbi:MAG: hypothetical protein U5J98_03935 [Halobacteriales archaeon]|nr:hypothetical protein [Halobacteriales archaeon]
MSLSVADALRDGLSRTFERSGLQLIVVFVVLRALSTVADDTLTRANVELAQELGGLPGGATAEFLPFLADAPTPYALGVGLLWGAVIVLVVAVIAEAVRIVAVRTLVSDRTDAVPAAFVSRNIVAATLNGFVGGIVVLTLTAIGLLVLVVPGVFLALSFFFVRQEIAVRDVNFVDAMAGSWELTSGSRIELLGLAAVIVFVGILASIPGVAIGFASPAVGTTVGIVARAGVLVFGIASAARAYDQLRAERDGLEDAEEEEAPPDEPEEPNYEDALSADDLAPPDAEG